MLEWLTDIEKIRDQRWDKQKCSHDRYTYPIGDRTPARFCLIEVRTVEDSSLFPESLYEKKHRVSDEGWGNYKDEEFEGEGHESIFLLYFFWWFPPFFFCYFFFHFFLFLVHIACQFPTLEEVHIPKYYDDDAESDLTEIIEDSLISVDEKYTQ